MLTLAEHRETLFAAASLSTASATTLAPTTLEALTEDIPQRLVLMEVLPQRHSLACVQTSSLNVLKRLFHRCCMLRC